MAYNYNYSPWTSSTDITAIIVNPNLVMVVTQLISLLWGSSLHRTCILVSCIIMVRWMYYAEFDSTRSLWIWYSSFITRNVPVVFLLYFNQGFKVDYWNQLALVGWVGQPHWYGPYLVCPWMFGAFRLRGEGRGLERWICQNSKGRGREVVWIGMRIVVCETSTPLTLGLSQVTATFCLASNGSD